MHKEQEPTVPEVFLGELKKILTRYSNIECEKTVIELYNLCKMMSSNQDPIEIENFFKNVPPSETIQDQLSDFFMHLTLDHLNISELQKQNSIFNTLMETLLFYSLENLPRKYSKKSTKNIENIIINKVDQAFYYKHEEVTLYPLNVFEFDDDKTMIINERISLLMSFKHPGICEVYGKYDINNESFLVVPKYETNFEEYLSTISDFNLKLVIIKDIISLCWFLQSKGIGNFEINTSSFLYQKYPNSISIKYFNFFNRDLTFKESTSPISQEINENLIEMIKKISSIGLTNNQAVEYKEILEAIRSRIPKDKVLGMLITWMDKQKTPYIEYMKDVFDVLENLLIDN